MTYFTFNIFIFKTNWHNEIIACIVFLHIFLVNMGILGLIHEKEQNKFLLVVYQ